eukprot:UN06780
MSKKQTLQQIFALCLLMMVGGLVSYEAQREEHQPYDGMDFALGITFCFSASLLSGFAASLCQRALQTGNSRHSFFYSAELALFSLSCLFPLLFIQLLSGSGERKTNNR